jgi:cytochrome c oxidase subunit 3
MTTGRKYIVHPSYIVLALILFGVTSLFLGLSGSYIYNRVQTGAPPIKLPWLFYLNTLFLLGSSYTLIITKRKYLNDETEKYKLFIGITLVLTLLFMLLQIMAWFQLQNQDIFINYSNMASYIYLISGVHFLHVVAGIPFLMVFIYKAIKHMKSPVSVLIYFSDPDRKRGLNLLMWYWHFLDGLWIYLVIFFLINYFIG